MYKSRKEPQGYWQHRGGATTITWDIVKGKTIRTRTNGNLWSCVWTGRLNQGLTTDND